MALNPALQKMVKDAKNKYQKSSNSIKLTEGKTTLRLVSKPDGTGLFADLGVHWIKTEKNEKPVAVVGCREIVYGEACECCTAIDRASKSVTDDETLEIVKEWKGKKGVLVNALMRSGPNAKEEPQVVELTPTTFGQMMNMIEEYAGSDIDILSFTDGKDFIVERIGKGLDTKYTVMPAPLSKPVPKDTVDKLVDLKAHIEREFFRGDEPKALRAIGALTGVDTSRMLGVSRPSLLTGPAGAVDDAVVEEAAVVAELEAAEAPATKPPFDTAEEDAAALEAAEAEAAATAAAAKVKELKAKAVKAAADKAIAAAGAKPAAVAAKPATVVKPAAPAAKPAAKTEDFGSAVSQEDIDSMLAELDGV